MSLLSNNPLIISASHGEPENTFYGPAIIFFFHNLMLFEVMYTNITKKKERLICFPIFIREKFFLRRFAGSGRKRPIRQTSLPLLWCKTDNCQVLGTFSIHLRMSAQVVLQTFGYIFSLCDNADMLRSVFLYLREQDRIMRTAQNHRVNFRIFG